MISEQKIKSDDIIIMIFSTLYLSHNSTAIAYKMPSLMWAIICIGLFFILFIWANKRCNIISYLFPVTIISALTSVFYYHYYPGTYSLIVNVAISIMQFCAYPLMTYYVLTRNNKRIATYIFLVFCAIEVTTGISTIAASGLGANYVRTNVETIMDTEEYSYRMMLNVGDFHTVTGFAAMMPIVILCYKWRHLFNKPALVGITSLLIAGIFFYTVYVGQLTIALTGCVVAMCLFFLNKNINRSYFWKSIIGVALLLLIFRTFIPDLLRGVTPYLNSEEMTERLTDLANSMDAGKDVASGSDYTERMRVYNQTLSAIVDYPIIGAWFQSRAGGHSFIFDNIARFGLLGLYLLILFYKVVINRYIRVYKDSPWIYYYYYGLVIVTFFYVVNPDGMYKQMLFFYPVSAYMITLYTSKYVE